MKILNKLILRFTKNPLKRAQKLKKMGFKIGDSSQIYPSVSFGSEPYLVSIGEKSKITIGVSFITHDGGMHVIRNLHNRSNAETFGYISIGNNVFIGNKALIMPGVNIGDNCIIGAGSIVTKSFEKDSVIAGVPARKICSINEYYEKNQLKFVDTKNLTSFEKKEKLLKETDINNKIVKKKY